ncbi:MAG: DoxX family protein [Verrucomicrobia bacterium]|nr:MAG: DoxX family protein [Verrucomicrobiota bacterium]
MVALGILGLSKGDFIVIWQPVPKSFPGRETLVYVCALISLASGVGLVWQRTAAIAARVLLLWFLLWLLIWRLPAFARGFTVDVYWAACQTAVMLSAAWVLYNWFATDWDKQRLGFAAGENGLRIARVLYGLSLIPFGLAHFTYLKQTAVLVPAGLPWHVAWAYLTGVTFIAAGIAVIIGVWARLAAALATLQMGLFLLLVWIPRVAQGSMTAFQWGEAIVTWALMRAGWVMTDSYRGTPWFAVKTRRV